MVASVPNSQPGQPPPPKPPIPLPPDSDQPPPAALEGFKPDHDKLATELVPELKPTYAFFRHRWHVYVNGVWKPITEYDMRRIIREKLRGQRARGVVISDNLVRGILAMVKDDLFVTDAQLEAVRDSAYINLQNGLYCLKTFRLVPHRPELYMTTQAPFNYDEKAECPTFRNFLNTSFVCAETDIPDESLIRLVVQMIGYCLTPFVDLKASFWLYGASNSGKSTLIKLIKALAGTLHTTLDLNNLGESRFLLATIVDKWVVTCTEADSEAKLPDGLFKAMTGGGDELQADVKGKDPITFIPKAKFVWAMNNTPRVMDRTDAIFNRLYFVPFNRTIPKELQISDLDERLLQELPGIFNLAIGAYKQLRKDGQFYRCLQSEQTKAAYRLEMDVPLQFHQMIVDKPNPDFCVSAQAFFNLWVMWCRERGHQPGSMNRMSKAWQSEALGWKKVDKASGAFYYGYELKPEWRKKLEDAKALSPNH